MKIIEYSAWVWMSVTERPQILVVEDENKTATTIAMYLRREGFSAQIATSGAAALKELASNPGFALIILDLMLPDMRGEEICQAIRQESTTPIIMVTSLATEDQRIAGLDLGADDYVPKPFSPRELMARVRARLRHTSPISPSLEYKGLHIDLDQQMVRKNTTCVALTAVEFSLLSTMAKHPGRVFTRDQLLDLIRGHDAQCIDRTVDAHVKNLRRKIEDDRKNPRYVQTVFGVGYRFAGDNQ